MIDILKIIMKGKVEEDKYNKTSIESLVLGILAMLSSSAFFLLMPNKPFGLNIIGPINIHEEFNIFVFFLFLILLLGVLSIGSSIVAIVFGIKDFRGIYRGAHITKGKVIYSIGAIIGIASIIFIIIFLIALSIY
jgi:hypothetical protein